MFILDLSVYVSEVSRGSGAMVWSLVLMFWVQLGWSVAFLSSSTAPLLCPRRLSLLAGGSSEGGPSATCFHSLSQGRGIWQWNHASWTQADYRTVDEQVRAVVAAHYGEGIEMTTLETAAQMRRASVLFRATTKPYKPLFNGLRAGSLLRRCDFDALPLATAVPKFPTDVG